MEYYVNIFACVYCIVLEWIVRAKIRTETGGNGLWCVLNGFLRLFVAAAACLRAGISGGTERVPRGRIGSVGWSALWGAMAESGGWAVRVGDAESEIGRRGAGRRNREIGRPCGRGSWLGRMGGGTDRQGARPCCRAVNPHLTTRICQPTPVIPHMSTRIYHSAPVNPHSAPVIAHQSLRAVKAHRYCVPSFHSPCRCPAGNVRDRHRRVTVCR